MKTKLMDFVNKYSVYAAACSVFLGLLWGGLYSDISSAVCCVSLCLSVRQKGLTFLDFLSFCIIAAGLICSELIYSGGLGFIYEISKLALLFIPLGIHCEEKGRMLLGAVYWSLNLSSVIGLAGRAFGIFSYGIVSVINGRLHVQGLVGYANTMALFCGLGIILSVYYRKHDRDKGFIHEITLMLNGLCMLLTMSRLGFAALAASALIVLCIRYRRAFYYIAGFFVLCITGIAVLFATGKESLIIGSTLACRFIYWQDALDLIIKHPFGTGVHAWQDIQYSIQSAQYSVKYVHNGFLQLALDGGIASLAALVLLIAVRLKGLVGKYKNQGDVLYLYLTAAVLFVAIHSFVDVDMAYGGVWLMLGIFMSFGGGSAPRKTIGMLSIAGIALAAVTVIFVPEKPVNTVQGYIYEYNTALMKQDYSDAAKAAKKMVEFAPRQQIAYDSYYYALEKSGEGSEISLLREAVDEINASMNPMCKYLSEHEKIILPIGGKEN